MKVTIKGSTDSIITLNKIGVALRGQCPLVIDISTEDQISEIKALQRAKLVTVMDVVTMGREDASLKNELLSENIKRPTVQSFKSKTEKKLVENRDVQEDDENISPADKLGSKVVVGTGAGVAVGKMVRTTAGEFPESARTAQSLKAMEDLQKEEAEDNEAFEFPSVDESKLSPSDQMGREAIVSTGSSEKRVGLTTSIVGAADIAKKQDPFVDRKANKERNKAVAPAVSTAKKVANKDNEGEKEKGPFIDDIGDGEYGDQFIEST